MDLKIESSSFGLIVINGKKYTSDLMIYPDGHVEDSWWRKRGHLLSIDDIGRLVASEPQVIVVGMGVNGLMNPEPGLENILLEKGIKLISRPTREAIDIFNEMTARKKIAACFHLTC